MLQIGILADQCLGKNGFMFINESSVIYANRYTTMKIQSGRNLKIDLSFE